MGMSIEEIIARETEIAQEFQEVIDTHMTNDNFSLEEMYCDDTEVIDKKLKQSKKLSDYHNTIANTMRKYQKIKEIINNAKDSDSAIKYNWLYEQISGVMEDGTD